LECALLSEQKNTLTYLPNLCRLRGIESLKVLNSVVVFTQGKFSVAHQAGCLTFDENVCKVQGSTSWHVTGFV